MPDDEAMPRHSKSASAAADVELNLQRRRPAAPEFFDADIVIEGGDEGQRCVSDCKIPPRVSFP